MKRYLPKTFNWTPSNERRQTLDRKTKARRALLVDDDKMMLVVLTDMLHDLGVTGVVTAGNGIAGIGAYDRVSPPPEIVVRDLHMPLRSPS